MDDSVVAKPSLGRNIVMCLLACVLPPILLVCTGMAAEHFCFFGQEWSFDGGTSCTLLRWFYLQIDGTHGGLAMLFFLFVGVILLAVAAGRRWKVKILALSLFSFSLAASFSWLRMVLWTG